MSTREFLETVIANLRMLLGMPGLRECEAKTMREIIANLEQQLSRLV